MKPSPKKYYRLLSLEGKPPYFEEYSLTRVIRTKKLLWTPASVVYEFKVSCPHRPDSVEYSTTPVPLGTNSSKDFQIKKLKRHFYEQYKSAEDEARIWKSRFDAIDTLKL